ncbi:MAG: hypothetical protein WBF01_03895 [Candidatus Acidiferrum sp.]
MGVGWEEEGERREKKKLRQKEKERMRERKKETERGHGMLCPYEGETELEVVRLRA